MNKSSTILRIAIPTPLRRTFDYLLPQDLANKKLTPGIRVKVPFGRRITVGLLIETSAKPRIDIKKLKPIIEILDDEPLLPPVIMELNIWASNYYHHPIGEVMLSSLPKLLRDGKPAEIKDVQTNPLSIKESLIQLNKDQQQAVNTINSNTDFNVFLLDGVTGSGKTEVYLQVIEKIITQGKQALILVPEIGLTPQTVARFQNRFATEIAVLHSKLTDRERLAAWLKAKNDLSKIIIGTRSAIFTPLIKPGIIIIDEEHDQSFRQQSGLRYSARDLAVMRGKLENIPIVLGSATPSLESLYNVKYKHYTRLQLPERAGTAIHPSFHLIDMRNQKTVNGLSEKLIQAMKNHLAQDGQILLFLNRRGFAPTLLCHSCGFVVECNRCDARMTFHQQPHYLHCHHCGATKPIYKTCPKCNSDQIIPLGLGTERIEETLKNIFPATKLLRIDRDTTSRKNAMQKMLTDIHNHKYQILIGTQMLAKGHHFPNVTMAVIINSDNSLLSSDFRATEHIAQLIMQVAGRAGRAEKSGQVFIQTYNPHHPLLLQLINHGYYNFASENLIERQKANLPPFSYFALIRAEAKTKKTALQFLADLKQPTANTQILGPIPAPLERKAGMYRTQLLIKSNTRSALHKTLDLLSEKIENAKFTTKIRKYLDVDPMDMF